MEPVSLLLATGAIAVYAAHRAEKCSEKARRGPSTLPELIAAPLVDDSTPVLVLAVHLRSARLSAQLARERLKVRVKYGEPGASIHCDTSDVRAVREPPPLAAQFVTRLREPQQTPEPASVEMGTTCLFLGHRQGESVIRIRLMRTRLRSRTLARAETRLPYHFIHTNLLEERELRLLGSRHYEEDEVLGVMSVGLEMRAVPKGELRRYLALMGAQQQQEAFLVGSTPVVQGKVEELQEDQSVSDRMGLVAGEAVSVKQGGTGRGWRLWNRQGFS